jgi:hypothetical protein
VLGVNLTTKKGTSMTKFVWIPESPTIHNYYAAKAPAGDLIKGGGIEYGTYDVNDALHFETPDECAAWCDEWNANQEAEGVTGLFEPRQHGFFECDA